MAVRILITGGTFDKEYDEITGKLYFKETHMREILELGRSRLPVKIRTLMMVDSLDMTENDRELILNNWKTIMTILTTISIIWVLSHIIPDVKRYYVQETFCDKDSTLPHLRPDALG